MVDVALGLGSLALLIPANNLILNVVKHKPHMVMGIPAVSMFVNAIISLGYGVWLKPYAGDRKLFVGGLLLAILANMVIKLNKLLRNG